MNARPNYKSRSCDIKLEVACRSNETSKTVSKLNIEILEELLKLRFSEHHVYSIKFDRQDFFSTYELIHDKTKAHNLHLKVCGSCLNFGFSYMSYNMSGGRSGYCGICANKKEVVYLFDFCDGFAFRDKNTETSPWLPS